jgi:hypothetical protein
MTAQGQPNSPFNFIQVIIGAVGTSYLNVIIFFLTGAAGASRQIGADATDVVPFDHILQFTLAPILFFGLVVFLIGRAKKGVCKIAQWVGLAIAVVSIIFPIMNAADVATAVGLSLIHIATGIGWFFSVHYGNKQLHVPSKDVALV